MVWRGQESRPWIRLCVLGSLLLALPGCQSFMPNFWSRVLTLSWDSYTHQYMTEQAILNVTMETLKSLPGPHHLGSQGHVSHQGTASHSRAQWMMQKLRKGYDLKKLHLNSNMTTKWLNWFTASSVHHLKSQRSCNICRNKRKQEEFYLCTKVSECKKAFVNSVIE